MKKKPDTAQPRKVERNTQESRAAIMSAAFRLFSEQGFHGATTREIAASAGVSEGLIFHHFENKVGILVAIFEEILAGAGNGFLRAVVGGQVAGSLEEVLKQAFDQIEAGARTGRLSDFIRMFLNSMMAVPDREKEVFVRRIHDALWFPVTQQLSRYLKGSNIDPYVFFRMVQGAFMGYILFQEVLGWKSIIPVDAKTYRDTAARILAAAVETPKPEKKKRTTRATGARRRKKIEASS